MIYLIIHCFEAKINKKMLINDKKDPEAACPKLRDPDAVPVKDWFLSFL